MTNTVGVIHEEVILGQDLKVYGTKEYPLFLVKDVATWIEYNEKNAYRLYESVEEDERQTCSTYYGGQIREMKFLTEEGIYEVLMQSRKPIAKSFKKEVKKALKQIRMTGAYIEKGREDEMIAHYFSKFSDSTKLAMLNELEESNAKIQAELNEAKPKAEKWDMFLDENGTVSLQFIGKKFLDGLSSQKTRERLQSKGVLFMKQTNGAYLPKKGYEKYFFVKMSEYNGVSKNQTRVTREGIDFIVDLMNK